ncbi:MAG: hypothetical protein ACD_69C00017G0002 [uncultured bacterium]|nr:MAG: hypothetical protein ACD_69C00017G0002 [uncultured bacterium]
MTKQADLDTIFYHTGLSKNMLQKAEYAVLPGDPHRSESLAKVFDSKAKLLADSREHISYLANFHSHNILICSTGLGSPNIGITMEELAPLGIKYFLRVGTCGAIQSFINLGDIVISSASVRLDGTSKDYAPIEYPAVASFEFTNDIIHGAQKANIPHHLGITASTDTFWQGQERYDNYSGYLLQSKRGCMAEWRALNVLNFEMESSALLTIANTMGLHAACMCGVVAVRYESEAVSLDAKHGTAKFNWEKVATEGIYYSLKRRNLLP